MTLATPSTADERIFDFLAMVPFEVDEATKKMLLKATRDRDEVKLWDWFNANARKAKFKDFTYTVARKPIEIPNGDKLQDAKVQLLKSLGKITRYNERYHERWNVGRVIFLISFVFILDKKTVKWFRATNEFRSDGERWDWFDWHCPESEYSNILAYLERK